MFLIAAFLACCVYLLLCRDSDSGQPLKSELNSLKVCLQYFFQEKFLLF